MCTFVLQYACCLKLWRNNDREHLFGRESFPRLLEHVFGTHTVGERML